MASNANGNLSDDESLPASPPHEIEPLHGSDGDHDDDHDHDGEHEPSPDHDHDVGDAREGKPLKSALKPSAPVAPEPVKPELPPQPDPATLDLKTLTPLSPEIIARQATVNIGTIGHVAHGKSTVVKAISGVQTVRFKNELERNITIKLGYANAKIYKCDNVACPRPGCYRSYKSDKEVDPSCEREGCGGRYRLLRHVSYVKITGFREQGGGIATCERHC